MEQEVLRDEIEIDISELCRFILSKIVLVLFVGALGAGALFAYTKFMVTPMYTSSTQVYILNKPETDSLTTSDLAFATYLARDYQEIMVSDPVMKKVIQELNLNTTTKALKSAIKISLKEDTRILQIDVVADNPDKAKAIADSVRDNAKIQSKEIMGGIEAINAIDEASTPNSPSSPNILKNTAIGFVGGAFLVIVILVILFLMDDTIKTQEDIEKYLGISVLATIPIQKESGSSTKKKSKRKKKEA